MLQRLASASTGNAYLLLAIAALCWAGNHVTGRAIAGHVPPVALSVLRWVVALAIALPFAWPHLARDWPRIVEGWRSLLFLGFVGGAIFSTLQYVGLEHTSALNMAVLNSLPPAVIVTLSFVIFGDRISPLQLFGLVVSLSGVMVIITEGMLDRLLEMRLNVGDLIIIANMVLWSIYSACLRLRPPMHWLSFLAVLSAVAILGNLPLMVLEHMSGKTLQATGATALAVLYAGVFPSFVAYACWSRGVELIGAPRAGAFLHLVPPFGVGLAVLLLGERPGLHHLAGLGLILIGVRLASLGPR